MQGLTKSEQPPRSTQQDRGVPPPMSVRLSPGGEDQVRLASIIVGEGSGVGPLAPSASIVVHVASQARLIGRDATVNRYRMDWFSAECTGIRRLPLLSLSSVAGPL